MNGVRSGRASPSARIAVGLVLAILATGYMSVQSIRLTLQGEPYETKIESITERRDRRGRLVGYSVSYYVRLKKRLRPILGFTVIPVKHRDQFKEGQEVTLTLLRGRYPVTYLTGYMPGSWPLAIFGALVALALAFVVWTVKTNPQSGLFEEED